MKTKNPTITLVFDTEEDKNTWLAEWLTSGERVTGFVTDSQKMDGKEVFLGHGDTLILHTADITVDS